MVTKHLQDNNRIEFERLDFRLIPVFNVLLFNTFKPNRISDRYYLEQSLSVLRDIGGLFHFYSNFNRTFCTAGITTSKKEMWLKIAPCCTQIHIHK